MREDTDMDVTKRSETRTETIVEINDVEFELGKLAREVSWLRYGEWDGEHEPTLQKMKEAGLARRKTKRDPYDMSVTGHTWEQVDRKCSELFDELSEPYSKWRVKCGRTTFGPWNELEDEKAKELAVKKKKELEERNPDVEFRLDEEELRHFPKH